MTTRRIFLIFDLDQDLARVQQFRTELAAAKLDPTAFLDPADFGRISRHDKGMARQMIRDRVTGTSVSLVLIGSETASRSLVQVGIEESIANQNGFLGIHIHGIEDQNGEFAIYGLPPILRAEIEFPCRTWDRDPGRLLAEIEAAGRRADAWRARSGVGSTG